MNRISTFATNHSSTQTLQATLAADLADVTVNSSTAYAAWVPLQYEENYAYPLLVWLHGNGENEEQLRDVMPIVSLRNYVAVAPQASTNATAGDSSTLEWCQSDSGVATATQRVMYFIDLMMDRYNVASERVFLGGYAEGGTMAMRIGMAHPNRFAGIASFGGAFPESHAPLRNLKMARNLNILMAQGRHSAIYNEADFCGNLRLLHYAGMSTTFRQYPGEDELSSAMLRDLDSWMMDQVTGGHACCDPEPSNNVPDDHSQN